MASALLAAVLCASLVAAPLAVADELTVASVGTTQLDRLKSDAGAKIAKWRKAYKADMTSRLNKRMKSLGSSVAKAKKQSTVATALGKAEVIAINAKYLHKDKAKAVKQSTKLYSAYKAQMDASQRKSFSTNKANIKKARTQKRLASLINSRTLMVDRAKLAKHIDTRGWSRQRIDYVNEWGKRNNSYLSGTAMAGTGYLIANAAYKTGIDPRLYSAIAEIESGRGAQPYGNQYNVCGWIWNPPAMYSWQDAAEKWHNYFKSYFAGETYPIQSMHGYCSYSPSYVNREMAKI